MQKFKRRTQWLRFFGAGCVLAVSVTYMWTRTPYNEFRSFNYVLAFIFSMMVIVAPAIYWESVCRLTPRYNDLYGALVASAIRIVAFVPASYWSYMLLLRGYSVICNRLLSDIAWWPTIYEALAIGIAAAFLLLVIFDFICSKVVNQKKGTSQS